jgi:phosphoglycerol geranylgeranyltransferase
LKVFDYLIEISKKKGAGYLPLVDPEKSSDEKCEKVLEHLKKSDMDAVLVGGSTMSKAGIETVIKKVKEVTDKPVIIFPGCHYQVSGEADAIFFMSLLSGRNPQFLIDEQVKASKLVKECGLETIPVAYLLIESGNRTSVERVSKTKPLPRNDVESIVKHALAGKYMGMKMCYMDGGSGAKFSIPEEVISAVKKETDIPLIIGGGIRDTQTAKRKVEAGADFIVTGSVIERNPYLLSAFSDAIHFLK